MNAARRVNLRDIAEASGVSIQTVSRAVRGLDVAHAAAALAVVEAVQHLRAAVIGQVDRQALAAEGGGETLHQTRRDDEQQFLVLARQADALEESAEHRQVAEAGAIDVQLRLFRQAGRLNAGFVDAVVATGQLNAIDAERRAQALHQLGLND